MAKISLMASVPGKVLSKIAVKFFNPKLSFMLSEVLMDSLSILKLQIGSIRV